MAARKKVVPSSGPAGPAKFQVRQFPRIWRCEIKSSSVPLEPGQAFARDGTTFHFAKKQSGLLFGTGLGALLGGVLITALECTVEAASSVTVIWDITEL